MSEKPTGNARAALFQDRNFRWLLSGSILSMLGDQFTLIALPWLVLKMTGDTLMLGAVLAVISVPRALSSCSAAHWSIAIRRSRC